MRQQKFIEILENLKKNDPSSIAVIFSDHGSGYIANKKRIAYSKSKSALDERTETIMLVKSPQECHKFLTTQMGPINLSRFIISCLSKKKSNI